jgi:hypothetical protein
MVVAVLYEWGRMSRVVSEPQAGEVGAERVGGYR